MKIEWKLSKRKTFVLASCPKRFESLKNFHNKEKLIIKLRKNWHKYSIFTRHHERNKIKSWSSSFTYYHSKQCAIVRLLLHLKRFPYISPKTISTSWGWKISPNYVRWCSVKTSLVFFNWEGYRISIELRVNLLMDSKYEKLCKGHTV